MDTASPDFSGSEDEPRSPATEAPKKRKRDEASVPELEIDVSLPEPPSKKSLRKAKKQKPDSKPTAPEGPDEDEAPAAAKSEETSKASGYSIWIGNLPWAINKAALRSFITENSNIIDTQITRVHMPPPRDAKTPKNALKPLNKGFAYVDFTTREALELALALSETPFGERKVLIKDAKSFVGRPEKQGSPGKDGRGDGKSAKKPSRRIFVGNLGFDVTKDDLTQHFQACGEVEDVHMATFEDTGKCKGFAWVTFADLAAGEAAVRGWVVTQPEEDDEDGGLESPHEQVQENDARIAKKKAKNRRKPGKWFVNRLAGRPLRCEFAEDATSRYKKRFGKDAGPSQKPAAITEDIQDEDAVKAKVSAQRPSRKLANGITPGETTDSSKRRGRNAIMPRHGNQDTRYRTGAIAEPIGSKTVFE